MGSSKTFLVAVLVATSVAAGPRLDLQSSVALLERADGSTDHEQLAAALDAIRGLGSEAAPAAATLSDLVQHRSKLYTDRDKTLVIRLRAYVVATMSDVGVPSEALPWLLETLVNVDERMAPMEVGAAVRAVGTLGPRGQQFVPHLVSTLRMERFNAEEFSLERYAPVFPADEATTVQLETINALGLICAADDRETYEVLLALASNPDARVARAADRAVKHIQTRRTR